MDLAAASLLQVVENPNPKNILKNRTPQMNTWSFFVFCCLQQLWFETNIPVNKKRPSLFFGEGNACSLWKKKGTFFLLTLAFFTDQALQISNGFGETDLVFLGQNLLEVGDALVDSCC